MSVGREFEDHLVGEVAASPEQVWEAIGTGPGIDSWFMGHNEVDPGQGGAVRTAFGDYRPVSRVTAWEPPGRLAHGSEVAPDGRFVAYEFLVEGRPGSSTVVRLVTSGFLPGDDWADEYDAMTKGMAMFFATLVEYLNHFAGRPATPVTAFGPAVVDWERAWASLSAALGLTRPVVTGTPVRPVVPTPAPLAGTVYFTNPHTLGVRTGAALYRFLRGFRGPMIASHHIFSHVDGTRVGSDWRDWLGRVLG